MALVRIGDLSAHATGTLLLAGALIASCGSSTQSAEPIGAGGSGGATVGATGGIGTGGIATGGAANGGTAAAVGGVSNGNGGTMVAGGGTGGVVGPGTGGASAGTGGSVTGAGGTPAGSGGSGGSGATFNGSFKVFALNIKKPKNETVKQWVRSVFTAVDADVVCISESGDNPYTDYYTNNSDKRYPYVLQNSSYVAILSKTALTSRYGAPSPNGDIINYRDPYPPGWPDNSGMGNRSVGAVVNIGGRDVYVASVHLDSNNYFSKPLNEYQADGAAGPQRRGQVRAILKTVDTLAPGLPVVLAGDWNTASHFDWSWWVAPYPPAGHAGDTTPGPAGIQPAAPGNWAGTLELGAAGYHDAGKDFYKQVVTGDTPRSTWIPLGYTPVGYEHERIDMIWYRGNLTPSNFDTLDETNTPGISVWSTDHRGVVVTFSGL